MKFEDLEHYPEYPSLEVVEWFCDLALAESEKEIPEEVLGKLLVLSDKQWHTYQLPSNEIKGKIKNWLIQSGLLDSKKFLVSLLVISFSFSLDKEFYKKILDMYSGSDKWQFQRNYNNSLGVDMDPWWTLKKQK